MKAFKIISKYLILSILFLVVAMALGVLAIILRNNQQLSLLFLILLFVPLLISIAFIIIDVAIKAKYNKAVLEDKEDIIKTIDSLSLDEQQLSNVSHKDEELAIIASKINDISIHGTALKYGMVYEKNNFKFEINKLIKYGYLTSFAYVRLTNIYEDMLEKIKEAYPHIYIYKNKYYIDLIISDYEDKDKLENLVTSYKERNDLLRVVIAYYDELGYKDILEMTDTYIKDKNERVHIIRKDERMETFNNVIDKYRDIDVTEEGVLDNYLKDMISYLPFTNIGIKVEEDYLRVVTYKGLTQLHMSDLSEYKYKKEEPLLTYKDKKVSVLFASKENIKLSEKEREKMHEFLANLDNIVIYELASLEMKENRDRYDRLEELSSNLSYEVDEEYKVVHASKRLSDRYDNKLVNNICYEVLYGREEPCVNCPLKNTLGKEDTLLLGSNRFRRILDNGGGRDTIFLLNKPHPYVPQKEELQNRLLGLLNTDDAKGYLLIFKLDALEGLANKNKITVDELTEAVIKVLDIYGLTDNLYRKDNDEFVYVLEEANVADCISLAKQVSKCFLEKFTVAEGKEISFIPKILLLSYPLEVNTLFSLDSLTRSMFKTISKRGRLYRIDEEPLPIDNHRYFMEIVEESYKKENMPMTFKKVKDMKNKENLSYLELNYVDDAGLPIKEEEITLYSKIDNTYLTLVERVVRNINFENVDKVILPIGKEALKKQLFINIEAALKVKKISIDRVIYEVKEKDLYNNKEEVDKILDMGFKLSINAKDSNIYALDLSKYRYIKIDGVKLEKDKSYQEKVNFVLNKGIDLMVDDKDKSTLKHVRFLV